MTDARSPMRVLRAALFAAVCLSLAATGHSFTSGHDLPLAILLPAFAVTASVAWLAGGRRRGALSIGAGLLAAQAALHLLFARAQSPGVEPATHHAGASSPPHIAPNGVSPGTAAGTGAGASTGSGSAAGPDPGVVDGLHALLGPAPVSMLAAHLVAAAFCALWLARGEAAFFRLARAVGALAFRPLRLLFAAVPPPPAPRPLARPRPGAAIRCR
ncbi:hypothetical protein, partial [Streptomyces sp. NPDC004726]